MVDDPSTKCFLYPVYTQRVVLVPSARIILVIASDLPSCQAGRS